MSSESSPEAPPKMIILDIGKRKRKLVRRLRKGRGKLVDRVSDTIEDMRAGGQIAENAQAVVIVVERKRRKTKWGRFPRF